MSIDLAVVDSVVGEWTFVRDPMVRTRALLPVWAKASIPSAASLRLQGRMATAGGKRLLVPSRIEVLVDAKGRLIPPLLDAKAASEWPYAREVVAASTLSVDETVPTPPDAPAGEVTVSGLTTTENTVADAKVNGESVSLEGVLVVGVFDADGTSSDFFYVQDRIPGSSRQVPCGIKVIPQSETITATLKPGDICNVSGTVVPSSSTIAECYLYASTVTKATEATVPAPYCMTNLSTAGGQYGQQQALYARTPTTVEKAGAGLNSTGTLVKVCGRVQWIELKNDHVTYWIDDGSDVRRTVIEDGDPVVRTGLRVVSWIDSATPRRYQEGQTPEKMDYISFVGVVGAEFSEDSTPRPVPVVRVGRQSVRKIVYVDGADGNDSLSGLGWGCAKKTVQAGIDAASAEDEVWVKAGTYTRNGANNVAVMKGGVAVYGGFDGGESHRWERDTATNVTTLDGEGVCQVVWIENVPTTCRVDSLRIYNGGSDPVHSNGSGIYCESSEAAICGNAITGNTCCRSGAGIYCTTSPCVVFSNAITYNGGGLTGDGAGMACCGCPCTYIAHNAIRGNTGLDDGGGINIQNCDPVVYRNYIAANYSYTNGGAACIVGGAPVFVRNFIWDNSADADAGGIWCSSTDALIADNELKENTAGRSGGAIYFDHGGPQLVGNTLESNSAFDAGGAVCCDTASPSITDNTFTDNSTTGTGGPGGGAIMCTATGATIVGNSFAGNTSPCGGGAIACSHGLGTTISRNTFSQNTSSTEGGAIWCDQCEVYRIQVSRNTFAYNVGGDRGGAISLYNTSADIINNLFLSNQVTGTGGGAIYALTEAFANDENGRTTTTSIVNNTFVGNAATTALVSNGGAVLGRCYNAISITSLALVNNIFCNNMAWDWGQATSTGNSVWLDPPAASASSLHYCGAYSDISGTPSYHYRLIMPDSTCITQQMMPGDTPIFTSGYHLSLSGPPYTPLDQGCDQSFWLNVPSEDIEGVARPQGLYVDMGAYEAQQ